MYGFDVDSIEANVETASVSVEEGIEQLRQARRSQVDSLVELTLFLCVVNHQLIIGIACYLFLVTF